MMVPAALLLLGVLTAMLAPRVLARAQWPERELRRGPVGLAVRGGRRAPVLRAVDAVERGRRLAGGPGRLFAPAPHRVVDAYALGSAGGAWAIATALVLAGGGLWTGAMLTREVLRARARRRTQGAELLLQAPLLPGEETTGARLVVLEGQRPDSWWLPGPAPRLVVTTAALGRLKGSQLDAVLAHEQGHAAARHDWLLHCSRALSRGFPQVPVFDAFEAEMHRLVELAADDVASRRYGRLTIALALVGLNEDRGVFGQYSDPEAHVPQRVRRLLSAAPRLSAGRRMRLTALATLAPAIPLLVAFGPGLNALA